MRQLLFAVSFLAIAGLHAGEPAANITAAVNSQDRPEADRSVDEKRKPAEILSFFDIKPGMTIVDIFAGDGYYTELLSRAVGPEGKVTLHNNSGWLGYVGKSLEKRLEGNRLPNVTRLDREVDELELPEGKADAIFLVLSFHDLYYTDKDWPAIDVPAFLAKLKKGLAPGGFLAIIDHNAAAGAGSSSAQKLHRVEDVFAKKIITEAGFRFDSELNVLRNTQDDHSILVFDEAIRRKTDRFVYKFVKPE